MDYLYTTAFESLRKLGVPVYVHADDKGNFSIDAEAPGADAWVDYHDGGARADFVFGVHLEVERILQQLHLFAEWVNPGRLAIYEG